MIKYRNLNSFKNNSLILIFFLILIITFQNCSKQSGLSLKILEGKGLELKLSSSMPFSVDETSELIPIELKISSPVQTFTESMIEVENATISEFSGEGTEFKFKVKPINFGLVKVSIPKGVCVKRNSKIPCAESNTLQFNIGNTAPSVTLSSFNNAKIVSDNFQLRILFSKKYFFSDLGKLETINAKLQNLSLNSDNPCECEYFVTVVPTAKPKEEISIRFKENIFFNKWGLGNLSSNIYKVVFDAVIPEVILSTQALDEVFGTFEVLLISSIPIPPATLLNETTLGVIGGKLINIKSVDSFKKILEIQPSGANDIYLQMKENVIINQWDLGNLESNKLEKKYSDSKFEITFPTPLITLNGNNVHSYKIEGICPYIGKDVRIYIYKPNHTPVATSACEQNMETGRSEFKFSAIDFGSDLSVGSYPISLETSDPLNYLIKKEYSITMAPSINPIDQNIVTTPNLVFFKDKIVEQLNTQIYSNEVYISGLAEGVELTLSFDQATASDLDPKFKVIRNGALVAEAITAKVQNGDIVQLSMVLINKTHGDIHSVNVHIGNTFSTKWKVKYHLPDAESIIFVSSKNIGTTNFLHGSISTANKYCNDMAIAAGFKANKPVWKAMIAEADLSLYDKMPWAWSRLYRTDGALVASGLNRLLEENLNNSINRTETGALSQSTMVATGFADSKGSIGTSNTTNITSTTPLETNTSCTFWTTGGGPGVGGSVSVGDPFSTNATKWFYSSIPRISSCWDHPQPIYCVADTSTELFDSPMDVFFPPRGTPLPQARVTSDEVLIKGITKVATVVVLGTDGNPKLSINGGEEISNGKVSNGDILRIHLNTPSVLGVSNSVTIKIGPDTYSWKVTYIEPNSTARIFVSSVHGYGSFFNPSGVLTADYTCTDLATKAGLGGLWTAILSDKTTNAIDRISLNWAKVILVDGTQVATSIKQLFGGILDHAISKDEYGKDLSLDPYRSVLTGTLANGNRGSDVCSVQRINIGDLNAVDGSWMNVNSVGCYSIETHTNPRIYCLEKK